MCETPSLGKLIKLNILYLCKTYYTCYVLNDIVFITEILDGACGHDLGRILFVRLVQINNIGCLTCLNQF